MARDKGNIEGIPEVKAYLDFDEEQKQKSVLEKTIEAKGQGFSMKTLFSGEEIANEEEEDEDEDN